MVCNCIWWRKKSYYNCIQLDCINIHDLIKILLVHFVVGICLNLKIPLNLELTSCICSVFRSEKADSTTASWLVDWYGKFDPRSFRNTHKWISFAWWIGLWKGVEKYLYILGFKHPEQTTSIQLYWQKEECEKRIG